MFSSREQRTWKALIAVLVLFAASISCGGSATQSDTSDSKKADTICDYTNQALSVLQQTQDVFVNVKAHIGDDTALERDLAELDRLATEFGKISAPEQASDLKIRTTGSIVAAGEILKAFLNGEDGATEGSLFLTIRKSAEEDIAQIRTAEGCN